MLVVWFDARFYAQISPLTDMVRYRVEIVDIGDFKTVIYDLPWLDLALFGALHYQGNYVVDFDRLRRWCVHTHQRLSAA
jgi:hypothetical protein